MKPGQSASKSDASSLHSRAEQHLKRLAVPISTAQTWPAALQKLVHELQVHQIELELQNEELRAAHADVQAGLDRYADFYDFSPTGFISLDRQGGVLQINLAGARLLGRERARLLGARFEVFVTHADVMAFQTLVAQVFETQARQTAEVTLNATRNLPPTVLQIEATLSADAQECRAVLLDVSEQHQHAQQLQDSRDSLRALAVRLQTIREEQNAFIAREIHDVLAQELTQVKIDMLWLERRLVMPLSASTLAALSARVIEATRQVDTAITTVQKIATELRPVILDTLGLFAAVEWQVDDFALRSGIACQVTVPTDGLVPDRDRAIALFRILQECLTNILRHAKATAVNVNLVASPQALVLTVQDNGIGITAAQTGDSRSLGVIGMGERALAFGGTVALSGAPGLGTRVSVRLPLEATR